MKHFHLLQEDKYILEPMPPRCPNVECPPIWKVKPCPDAKPLYTTFKLFDMMCKECPKEWDPFSCGCKNVPAYGWDAVDAEEMMCPREETVKPDTCS